MTEPELDLHVEEIVTMPKAAFDEMIDSKRTYRRIAAGAFVLLTFTISILGYRTLWSDPHREESANEEANGDRDLILDRLGDVQDTADRIKAVTSPEAVKAQAETLRGALVSIDCSNREALQALADALAEAGTAKPITVTCQT